MEEVDRGVNTTRSAQGYGAARGTSETAVAMGVSVAAVRREWRYIRVWLEAELSRESRS
ncbi:MAG: ECF-type sigma factor [Planctomycetota bacterium]